MPQSSKDTVRWLDGKPSLDEMRARFPGDWSEVEREIATALSERSHAPLDRLLMREASGTLPASPRGMPRRMSRKELATRLVRKRMAVLALEHVAVVAATGTSKAEVAPAWFTRLVTNVLFRDRKGAKKPVSLILFRLLWPLVINKAAFLTFAQSRGTYCFFSAPMIDELARLMGHRKCVEIAAGDGTLSRFLRDRSVDVVATDDHSWTHEIDYPEGVARMDARDALRVHRPEVVICSWPPAANAFERYVFETDSVERYIVVGSRHEFAAGAWNVYAAQKGFAMSESPLLARLVLPPETGVMVRVFDRRKTQIRS